MNSEKSHDEIILRWRGDAEAKRYYKTPWNVQGLLQEDAIGWIYGAPGSYKTVMAMDLACSIATGREWCGQKTRQGPVLYISAEGGAGIYAMRDAWEKKTGAKADHLAIYVGAPDISNVRAGGKFYEGTGSIRHRTIFHPTVELLKEFREFLSQPAALIVIDTYAQTSADDTKAAVTAYERSIRNLIRESAPGASVLVIDHTTKEGTTWMGSNAKLGNMDMMGLVKRAGDDVILTMRGGKGKVKNAPAFDDIRMTPRLIDLGWKTPEGSAAAAPALDYCETTLTERETLLLDLIGDGSTYAEVRQRWHDHGELSKAKPAARKAALSRAIKALREKDVISVEGVAEGQSIAEETVILPL